MEDPKEIALIAEGLSEGQHAVLMETTPGVPRLYVAAPGIPRVALFSKRLLRSHGDVSELPLRFELTPLGEAVREALLTPTREDQSHD